MNQKNKRLFGNVGILAISNFSTKILSLLLVPLYTSILSTEEYGVFDLVVTTVELLIPILTLNISDAVMRFLLDTQKSKDTVSQIGLKYLGIALTLASVVVFACSRIDLFSSYATLFVWIWLYFILHLSYQFLVQYAKGLEHVKDIGIAGVLSTIINLSCNILFLVVFKWGIKGFFISNILASGLVILYMVIRLKIWRRLKVIQADKQLEKEMLSFCIPLIFTAIAWWANSSLDKYAVTFFCGVAANGLISVAYKIPSIVNTLQAIFIQAWQISAIREFEDKDKNQFYENIFIGFNFLLCVAGFGLIFLSRFIASIMFSDEFFVAWKYVPFLVIASIINAASGFIGPILSAQKKTKPFAISATVGLISNAILNCILVFLLGIQGATVATVVSSFLMYCVRKKACLKFISTPKHMLILLQWLLLCLQAIVKICEWNIGVELVIGLLGIGINLVLMKNFIQSWKQQKSKGERK